jgi:hypothetical protein
MPTAETVLEFFSVILRQPPGRLFWARDDLWADATDGQYRQRDRVGHPGVLVNGLFRRKSLEPTLCLIGFTSPQRYVVDVKGLTAKEPDRITRFSDEYLALIPLRDFCSKNEITEEKLLEGPWHFHSRLHWNNHKKNLDPDEQKALDQWRESKIRALR